MTITIKQNKSNTTNSSDSGLTEKTNPLYEFAFMGVQNYYEDKIKELENLAEKEIWYSNNPDNLDRLKNYIKFTFARIQSQNKILYNSNNTIAIFNTGLLTDNSEEILCLFKKRENIDNQNENYKEWIFKYFIKQSDRDITNNFSHLPELASYTDNPNDYYFDSTQEITLNSDHILEDNWKRYPDEIKAMGKNIVSSLVRDAFEIAKKKVKRNNRLVVPQFYKNQIMYLMPINIHLDDSKKITLALAIEKTEVGTYRANTIFTLDMAYPKARLIMKPESNWLIKRT